MAVTTVGKIDPKYIVNRQGKDHVLYVGLLETAHKQGIKRMTSALVQAPNADNGGLAIVAGTVEFEDGRVFSSLGDASAENVGRMIAPHIVRMAECLKLDARILTREGWKYHDELRLGEDVLAFDPARGWTTWVPLQAITVYREPVRTVRLRSRSFDVTCTPDHTWAAARRGCVTKLVKTSDLGAGHSIIMAARATGGENPLSPREAALLGWLATDGWVSERGRLGIAQSKPRYIPEIAALVGPDGSHRVYETRVRDFGSYVSECLPQHKFELTASFGRQLLEKAGWSEWSDLTRIVTSLSIEARTAMMDAMLKGDGSQVRGGDTWVFGKKAKPGVMEAFEILATLEGRALGRPQISTVGDVPLRTVRSNQHATASYLRVEDGGMHPVWCPTTAFGTWIANTDGTITITGNTRAYARALRNGLNVGGTALEELGGDEVEDTTPAQIQPADNQPCDPARLSRLQKMAERVRAGGEEVVIPPALTMGQARQLYEQLSAALPAKAVATGSK